MLFRSPDNARRCQCPFVMCFHPQGCLRSGVRASGSSQERTGESGAFGLWPHPRGSSRISSCHVHRVSDAIQPSHPLSSPSPLAPNPSQHQSLFQSVNSLHEVAKVLAPYSSTLAWKILWMEEPGEPQSRGSQRVGHPRTRGGQVPEPAWPERPRGGGDRKSVV